MKTSHCDKQNRGTAEVRAFRFLQKRRARVIFVTYRPLESDGHRDGRALGNRVGVGAKDVGERGAVCARRLRTDDVLPVFEAHAKKELAVPGLVATEATGAFEGVDLQFEGPSGDCLGRGGGQLDGGGSNSGANTLGKMHNNTFKHKPTCSTCSA